MAAVKATEYCLCGASITLHATNMPGLKKAMAMWRESHTGEGHGQATRQQACMAREKQKRQVLAEVKREAVDQSLAGLDV